MFNRPKNRRRPTRAERLLAVLSDRQWHSTKQLIRRVGHTFAGAKFKLVGCGYSIERQRHPTRKYQRRYRLLDEPEDDNG